MATQTANMQTAMESQRVAAAAAAASQTAASSTALARAMAAMDSTLTLQRTQAASTAAAQATAVTAAITSLNRTCVSLGIGLDHLCQLCTTRTAAPQSHALSARHAPHCTAVLMSGAGIACAHACRRVVLRLFLYVAPVRR